MKTKTFDCVEMKRRGAARIYERTKDMTLDQKIDYWRRRSQVFRSEQRRMIGDEATEGGRKTAFPERDQEHSPG